MPKFNIPGWQRPEKIKRRKCEVYKFADKILDTCFQKSRGKVDLQKFRIHNPRTPHPQYFTTETEPVGVKEMVYSIAEKIWDFLYKTSPEELYSAVEEDIAIELENIKGYLKSFAGEYDENGIQRKRLFNRGVVTKVMKELSKNAYKGC